MVSSFVHETLEALSDIEKEKSYVYKHAGSPKENPGKRANNQKLISIATGTLFYPIMEELARTVENRMKNVRLKVYPVENSFFGGRVSVTGLLTGRDLVETLKGRELGHSLLLSRSMFRSGTEIMLDDITRPDLESGLGVAVMIIDNDGYCFINSLAKIVAG